MMSGGFGLLIVYWMLVFNGSGIWFVDWVGCGVVFEFVLVVVLLVVGDVC